MSPPSQKNPGSHSTWALCVSFKGSIDAFGIWDHIIVGTLAGKVYD